MKRMAKFKPTMLQEYDVYVTFGWEKSCSYFYLTAPEEDVLFL